MFSQFANATQMRTLPEIRKVPFTKSNNGYPSHMDIQQDGKYKEKLCRCIAADCVEFIQTQAFLRKIKSYYKNIDSILIKYLHAARQTLATKNFSQYRLITVK